ncbi:hypothetical protein [Lactobacillus xylocopicola]|uniref:Uncharacterized protein n=1 Tax=Lactobacillus xylocopicola TaxID=2976676 RepID=A0ABM8BEV2_9LACO|nr:hypothetical protein [Lactobacillus xylocopicola]BDR59764.1 hypothetical protein KIM322_00250 [Lactobacillus xylocopicola]
MNKNRLIKSRLGLAATVLFLVGGVSPAMATKNSSSNIEWRSIKCPVNGIRNFRTSYSGKTHKITFSGDATGFKNLTVKYGGKTVKAAKIKKNGQKFKVTVPFKGYKTFKLYGDKQLLKTISAKKYASKKPNIYQYDQTSQYLKIKFYGKKGDIVIIWKDGKPIQRRRLTADDTTMKVVNTELENNAKVIITEHAIGKKTSKGIRLERMKDGVSIDIDKIK